MDFTNISDKSILRYEEAVRSEKERYNVYIKSLDPVDWNDVQLMVKTMNALYMCKREG